MTKMLLSILELTILIINFLSINLKTALKKLQIENFKKHLMTILNIFKYIKCLTFNTPFTK